jgi:hypothetical protein
MSRTNFFRAVALTLALSTGFMGCVAPTGRPVAESRLTTCSGDDIHSSGLATADEGPVSFGAPTTETGLVQTHCGGGGGAALLVFAGIVIGFVVIADLLILPFTAPCHHSFCCTRGVWHSCCH